MTFGIPGETASGLIAESEGVERWLTGDMYCVKLTAKQTGGHLGLVTAWVPPGGGPAPHVHAASDEMFYLLDGTLEFLDGDKTFTASAHDAVFFPRGHVHRFTNVGTRPARMLFTFTPGTPEQLFVDLGDAPEPGVPIKPVDPALITPEFVELAAARYDTHAPPPPG